jgi:hypothetical protein
MRTRRELKGACLDAAGHLRHHERHHIGHEETGRILKENVREMRALAD